MKVLIAGLGSIGQRHARNLRRLLKGDLELLAFRARGLKQVITPTLEIDETKDIEDELNIKAFDSLASALAKKPDVVFVCNPSSMHIETALAAAEAGCDLFVEKPLAASMDGVNELIAAATEKKLIAMVGYQMRFHPCIIAAREALAEKTVGSPVSVRAAVGEFMPNFHHYEDYRSTYAARKHLGGGVMLSQIHEFDYLYSFFGAPKRIYAVGGHWSSLEIDVEDTASVLMECEVDGRPLPVHLHQDFLQNPPSRRCEIIATSGTIVLDFATLSVVISNRDSGELVTRNFAQYDRNTPFLDEMQHFLGCAKDRRKPVVDLAEGAQSLRTVLAAKRSMEEKRVIELSGPFLQ